MIHIEVDKATNCSGDYSLYISFPYNATLIDIIKGLPQRFWIKEDKEWEVPAKKLPFLMNAFNEYEVELICEDLSQITDQPKVCEFPFDFKTKPFDHQIDGFNYGMTTDRWLLGDEQGLGKTKQVIDIGVAKKLQKGYKHCLIICGVNGLKWNWRAEVGIHSNEQAHILGEKTRKNGSIKIGSTQDKIGDLNRIDDLPYFIITNVESFRDTNLTAKIAQLCKEGTIPMVAFDECHKAKDPTSQQGKGILKVQAETMIAMTGTPLMNTPMDLYIILKWLGFEQHSFYSFKQHYCEMGGFGGYQIVGYKNLDSLQEELDDIMLRRLKKDVLDLPEKLYIDEYVEMGKEQARIYKEVLADLKDNIDMVASSPNPLSQMIRLRQATGYTGILSSTIHESAKLDRLEELVAESYDNGQKVVIFSNWTDMTDAIYTRLMGLSKASHRDFGVAQITGETKDEERQNIVNLFQTSDDCSVLIGTIGAMGTGLTLTAGTVVIFVDHPWNRALYDQAVDRCHRIGQNSNITIYNLLTKDTIDERVWDLVQKKGAMSDVLVDKMSNHDMIDFLLS